MYHIDIAWIFCLFLWNVEQSKAQQNKSGKKKQQQQQKKSNTKHNSLFTFTIACELTRSFVCSIHLCLDFGYASSTQLVFVVSSHRLRFCKELFGITITIIIIIRRFTVKMSERREREKKNTSDGNNSNDNILERAFCTRFCLFVFLLFCLFVCLLVTHISFPLLFFLSKSDISLCSRFRCVLTAKG